jgi:heme A synthase
VYATAAYSIRNFPAARKVAIIGSLAVSIQIFIGTLAIFSELQPMVVAIHTGVGVISLTMMLLAFIASSLPSKPSIAYGVH